MSFYLDEEIFSGPLLFSEVTESSRFGEGFI